MADETCGNETMRDLLPLLAHDALGAGELAEARAHVASCAECGAELALIESAAAAITASAPKVSTAAILAEVQRRTRLRVEAPATIVARAPRRQAPRWMPRRFAAAAASLILVASASLAVLVKTFGGPSVDLVNGTSGTMIDSAPAGRVMAAAGISVTGGLSDLSEDDLTALLDELDSVEATVAAEPATLRRAIDDDQENF